MTTKTAAPALTGPAAAADALDRATATHHDLLARVRAGENVTPVALLEAEATVRMAEQVALAAQDVPRQQALARITAQVADLRRRAAEAVTVPAEVSTTAREVREALARHAEAVVAHHDRHHAVVAELRRLARSHDLQTAQTDLHALAGDFFDGERLTRDGQPTPMPSTTAAATSISGHLRATFGEHVRGATFHATADTAYLDHLADANGGLWP